MELTAITCILDLFVRSFFFLFQDLQEPLYVQSNCSINNHRNEVEKRTEEDFSHRNLQVSPLNGVLCISLIESQLIKSYLVGLIFEEDRHSKHIVIVLK